MQNTEALGSPKSPISAGMVDLMSSKWTDPTRKILHNPSSPGNIDFFFQATPLTLPLTLAASRLAARSTLKTDPENQSELNEKE